MRPPTNPLVISYPLGLGDVTTRVLESGTGPNRIVLLHGAGSRADRWRPAMPGLAAAGYHVYALDFPGHGFAAKPADFEYATPALADLVAEFLAATGPAAVVGTSLGGHVAAWLAVGRPELVTSVVLAGATGFVRRDTSTSAVLGDRSRAGVVAKLRQLLYDAALIEEDLIEEEWRINTSPGAEQALDQVMAYTQGAINQHLIGGRLAAANVPAAVVWGEHDQWIPLAIGRQVAALLPRSPFHVMSGTGHAPYFERPAAFNEIVLSFLGNL